MTNTAKQDKVKFKAGVTAADVMMRRRWNGLSVKIAATQDQLTIQSCSRDDDVFSPYGVEAICFAGLREHSPMRRQKKTTRGLRGG